MSDSDGKPGNFTITDRRGFDKSGEPKAEPQPARSGEPPTAEAPKLANAAPPPPKPEAPRNLPPADFATLVLSLGSSAVMYMGVDVEGKKQERNLPMAKHAVDLLTVLEEKTKGNLTAEEEHILGGLLFDLRLRYVEALKTASPSGS
jgi:hypothetical protein